MKKGSVTKRKDGRYVGRYPNIKDVYTKKGNHTEEACRELLDKAILEYENGIKENAVGKKMTLSAWLDHWFKIYKTPALKESSRIQWKIYINSINKKTIAKKEMSKIKPDDIVVFLDGINSNSSKKMYFTIFKDAFGKAYANGYLSKDITSFVAYDFTNKDEVDEEIGKEIKILTQDEEDKFLELLEEKNIDLYFAVKFSIYSGVRRGELFGIGLDDIDSEKKFINITKQLNKTTKKITSLKTSSSKRRIPIFKPLEDVLDRMKKHYKYTKNSRLFEKLNINSYTSIIDYYGKEIGMKITPHMFRHTFASKCYAMGIDVKQVAKWLGHSSIKTTQDIYMHLGLGDKTEEKAINLFNKLTPNL